jgi:hypothetical protein
MRSELSFLVDLFLREEVPASLKKELAERLKEIEAQMEAIAQPRITVPRGTPLKEIEAQMEAIAQSRITVPRGTPQPVIVDASLPPNAVQQSPSMQRLMQQHPDVPVVIAQPTTPAAAMALQQRAELLRKGMSEKPEPGFSAKRKI